MKIHHLGLWTLACGLGIAVYQSLTPRLNDQFRAFGMAYNLVMGVAFGMILAGAGVLSADEGSARTSGPSLPEPSGVSVRPW